MDQIQLTPKRLGDIDVRYAYGDGMIGGKPKLVVMTDHGDGGKLSCMTSRAERARLRPGLSRGVRVTG